jgi:hypothetical protein
MASQLPQLIRLRYFVLSEWKLLTISTLVVAAFVTFTVRKAHFPESAIEYRAGVIHDFDITLGRHINRGGPKATVIDQTNNRFYRVQDRFGNFEGCQIGDHLEFRIQGRITYFTRGSCRRILSPRGF